MAKQQDVVLYGSTTLEASSTPTMFVRRNTKGRITSSSGFSIEEAGVVFVPGMRYKVTVEAIGEVKRLDPVWHADPWCRKRARKTLAMYRDWLTKPNFVSWASGSQGSHAEAKAQIPRYEGAIQWSLGLAALRRRIAQALKTKPKAARMLDAETVKYHADGLITYILENESEDFVQWFSNDGWDDAAVCKALGKKEISEKDADNVVRAMEDCGELVDAIAYHAFGCDHIYTDAVQLDAFITGKVPKLTKAQVKKALA